MAWLQIVIRMGICFVHLDGDLSETVPDSVRKGLFLSQNDSCRASKWIAIAFRNSQDLQSATSCCQVCTKVVRFMIRRLLEFKMFEWESEEAFEEWMGCM